MKARFAAACAAFGLFAACSPSGTPPPETAAGEAAATSDDLLAEDSRPLGMSDENIAHAERAMPQMNPFENDLRDLEAAVQMTDAFRIKPDGVRLSFAATMSDGSKPFDEVFYMQPMEQVPSAAVARHTRDDYHLGMYRLAEEDKLRMAAAQTLLNALKETSDGNNQLNFSIEAVSCREPAAPEDAPYHLDVFFRTHPDTDFIPMYLDMVMTRDDPFAIPQLWDACEDGD